MLDYREIKNYTSVCWHTRTFLAGSQTFNIKIKKNKERKEGRNKQNKQLTNQPNEQKLCQSQRLKKSPPKIYQQYESIVDHGCS